MSETCPHCGAAQRTWSRNEWECFTIRYDDGKPRISQSTTCRIRELEAKLAAVMAERQEQTT